MAKRYNTVRPNQAHLATHTKGGGQGRGKKKGQRGTHLPTQASQLMYEICQCGGKFVKGAVGGLEQPMWCFIVHRF
jgi:hypothetical protein